MVTVVIILAFKGLRSAVNGKPRRIRIADNGGKKDSMDFKRILRYFS